MTHELTLEAGQTIEVTRKHRTGWWEGVTGDGTKGWFPSNVLASTPLTHTIASNSLPNTSTRSQQPLDVLAENTAGGTHTDISKAPGYGAYAKKAPAPAASAASCPTGNRTVERRSGSVGGHGSVRVGAGKVLDASSSIPAALAKETVSLLRDLRAAASALRGSAWRRPGSPRGRNGVEGASSRSGAVAALDGATDEKALEAEATLATLRAELAAQQCAAEQSKEKCELLQREKDDVAERYVRLEEELLECCDERDHALDELDSIKQDPDLYFAGLSNRGEGGGRGEGTKRDSHASDDVDFDDDDVDFESHAPARVQA